MTLSKRWYMYAYVISLTASIKFQKQIRDTSIISLFIKSKCNDLPVTHIAELFHNVIQCIKAKPINL